MAGLHWAGAAALAVGLTLFFLGIGFVARDEALGWLGVVGGPGPTFLGVHLMRKVVGEPRT